MKNVFNKVFCLMVVVVLVFVAGSCKKFLDVEPISEFDNGAVFSDVPNATLAVIGAYAPLSGNTSYGQHLSLYFPYDTDEGGVTGNDDNGRRGIGRYGLTSANINISGPWNVLYQAIERANICIEQIPLMDKYSNGTASEQTELKRLHGEVLTIRALCYFELIRNWGDVPAPMIPSYKQPNLNLPKMDRDELYDILIADLATASTLVPWRNAVAKDERITKGAVKGLRARIALFRGGYSLRGSAGMQVGSNRNQYYQIAKDECWDIIAGTGIGNHALNSSFEDLWKKYVCVRTLDPAGEIIFEVAMAGGNANDDSQLGNYLGIKSDPASRCGNGIAGVYATPTYFYAFDSIDTRRDVTIGAYTIGSTNIKTASTLRDLRNGGKFRREWSDPLVPGSAQYLGYNWPLIRYSDILLMFAEADNELNSGPSADAIAAFEAVRTRAYLGNTSLIGVTPTDKAGFFDAIVNERLLEFGGEGIRKYDLIRWNLLGSKITQLKTDLLDLKNGVGKYVNTPTVVFWVNNGEEVEWKTSFYKPTDSASYIVGTPPAGWKKLDWTVSITTTPGIGTIDAYAKFFTPNKSELMPIPQSVITASPGLEQNFGY